MKKAVTEFDPEKQSLRMYFQGRSAENIISAVLVGLIGLGAAWLDRWIIRGTVAELRKTGLDGEAVFLVCVAVVCTAAVAFALFVVLCQLFGKETGTLDENGFRYESRLGPLRYRRTFAPLEHVILFDVHHANEGNQNVTPSYELLVVLRKKYSKTVDVVYGGNLTLLYRGDDPGFHRRQLLKTAAMSNALLDRLKQGERVKDEPELRRLAKSMVRGYDPPADNTAEIVTHVETVSVGGAHPVSPRRPDGTPWRLKSGYDGSVFWRTEVFSIKMMLHSSGCGCLAAAVAAGVLWLTVYAFMEFEIVGTMWFYQYVVLGALALGVYMVVQACGEILKPCRRIIIRVSRHELRKETRTLGLRRTRGVYPLGGLAKIAVEHRRGAVAVTDGSGYSPPYVERPIKEYYALVFENAAGESLAEITDLTQDEARWMRDEILRNF